MILFVTLGVVRFTSPDTEEEMVVKLIFVEKVYCVDRGCEVLDTGLEPVSCVAIADPKENDPVNTELIRLNFEASKMEFTFGVVKDIVADSLSSVE